MKLESNPIINQNFDAIFRKNGILSGIKIPELSYSLPKITIENLSEYETLYLYPIPTLPLVNISIVIEGGFLQEPNELRGLYPILLELWQNGGTNQKTGEKVSEELANYGAEVSFSVKSDHILISFSCLKKNFQPAFEIFKELLLYPNFSEDKLKTIQFKFIDSLQRRNDKPEKIASRKIMELLFYPNLPVESISKDHVEKISRELILTNYKEILKQRRMHIAVDGDIEGIPIFDLFKEISKNFGPIQNPFMVKKIKRNPKGYEKLKHQILIVEKNVPQSVIVLGTLLPPYNSEEFYSLMLGNYILGGGSFVSKMMREIRVNRGLAYYSYSSVKFYSDVGHFLAISGTTSSQTKETLKIMFQMINDFSSLLSDQELQIAKDSITNSFIFEYNNPSRVLYMEILNRINDLPENFMEVFSEKIGKTSKQKAISSFKKYIFQKNLWILIVGPKEIQESLKEFHLPIKMIDPETSFDSLQ
ncbi:MAG: M16 family metallopeptidase [Leptonema sp. (in: bacteria)]